MATLDQANVFAEGVSAGMGKSTTKGTATLNRRGGSASDAWMPLLWAAKVPLSPFDGPSLPASQHH